MDKWNEFRTAYHVAKHGTVSAAADALGVHRATIIRHIDALEDELGGKIFFRNARGYSLTEIGEDLLRVAESTDDQFRQFIGRSDTRSRGVSGELIVSTIDVVSSSVAGAMRHFIQHNPNSKVRCILTAEVLRLEYGEAHIAIRAGRRSNEPENVVIPLRPLESGLYAHRNYIDAFGYPESIEQLSDHRFVGPTNSGGFGTPHAWLHKHVPDVAYSFESLSFQSRLEAIAAGIGLGFLPTKEAESLQDIVEIMAPTRAWRTPLWLVTHGATHRTAKVQSFLQSLRQQGLLKKSV